MHNLFWDIIKSYLKNGPEFDLSRASRDQIKCHIKMCRPKCMVYQYIFFSQTLAKRLMLSGMWNLGFGIEKNK